MKQTPSPPLETTAVRWPTPLSASLPPLGAVRRPDGSVSFTIWAPRCPELMLVLRRPGSHEILMNHERGGYFSAIIDNVPDGTRYSFRLPSGIERPDPASRYQPDGVHTPSQVVSTEFEWKTENWRGLPLEQFVIYEAHVGTFTPEGTFDAAIRELPRLVELGITALELMPVAQFPGGRNWGYDGVYPFAVQNSYGGPDGLKRLVDACHRHELAVILDVVYNHFGPEGNYVSEFAPYFTDRYHTPWGMALNFDGPYSDEVRRFFIENALYWVTEFRIDALRLDAVHAIADRSANPFLKELAEAVHRQGKLLQRAIWVIPESDANDSRLIRSSELGGYGLDAQWNDGFHHALRALLTGETGGYYCDYGEFRQLAKAYREGYVYTGEYSRFRHRRHGSSTAGLESRQFVVFSQNHDQIGNRMLGERLTELADFETLKLMAAAVLLSPFTPLLFMGEEYGETAPFQYFVSHSDAELVEAVRSGRREEFAAFAWQGEVPDPQAEETFLRSKLQPDLRFSGRHAVLNAFYTELLRLRRTLGRPAWDETEITSLDSEQILIVRRDRALVIFNFSSEPREIPPQRRDRKGAGDQQAGTWRLALNSASAQWSGPEEDSEHELSRIAGRSVVVYLLDANED